MDILLRHSHIRPVLLESGMRIKLDLIRQRSCLRKHFGQRPGKMSCLAEFFIIRLPLETSELIWSSYVSLVLFLISLIILRAWWKIYGFHLLEDKL